MLSIVNRGSMRDWKTVSEKALEWGCTADFVRKLIYGGRVEGAEQVTGQGVWLIPADATKPAPEKRGPKPIAAG